MTNRSIFNRRYTSYSPAGVEVYLLNGAGISSQLNPTFDFELGEDLDSGSVVYVSGAVIFAASAASGVSADIPCLLESRRFLVTRAQLSPW